MRQVFVWTVSDVLYVTVGGLLLLAWILVLLVTWWNQLRCKHDGGVNETRACDAICRQCGKNLGFILKWQKKNVAVRREMPAAEKED